MGEEDKVATRPRFSSEEGGQTWPPFSLFGASRKSKVGREVKGNGRGRGVSALHKVRGKCNGRGRGRPRHTKSESKAKAIRRACLSARLRCQRVESSSERLLVRLLRRCCAMSWRVRDSC